MTKKLDVLYEDNHLLVVNKPFGLATMGLPAGEETLFTRSKDYIAEKYQKPGNVYLGIVSRLDTLVTGVVVFARTSKAADRLNEQFRAHTVEKQYLAVVEGAIPPEGTLHDWIKECSHSRKCYVTKDVQGKEVARFEKNAQVAQDGPAKEAILHFRRLRRLELNRSLVEVWLETGRKHQIRVQLSHAGYPILGDWKYGSRNFVTDSGRKPSRRKSEARIALHARSLTIQHPTRDEKMTFIAPIPAFWGAFGLAQSDFTE